MSASRIMNDYAAELRGLVEHARKLVADAGISDDLRDTCVITTIGIHLAAISTGMAVVADLHRELEQERAA